MSGDPDIGNATYVYADVSRLTYEARIVTAEGTFLDRGTSYVHVDRFTTDVGFPFASFSESFWSSLSEPIRVPGSADECKPWARGADRSPRSRLVPRPGRP